MIKINVTIIDIASMTLGGKPGRFIRYKKEGDSSLLKKFIPDNKQLKSVKAGDSVKLTLVNSGFFWEIFNIEDVDHD